ncbi:hypothetical protein EJB05_11794, partial [Eragrostis curvula]
MEAFHGARLVRLRCCARGMYLAAEEDKTGVCLRRGRRAADNVLWSARPAAGPEGAAAVLLCGFYGLFLAASDRPASVGPPDAVEAQQRALDDDSAPPPDMLWQAVCSSSEDGFLFRNCGGRFLRANGKYLRWRRGVTVAASDNSSSMLRWAVEAVPVEQERLLDLGRPGRQELLQSLEAMLKEEKGLLQSTLKQIEEEEAKKRSSMLKMKCAQEKRRGLMAEEKRGSDSLESHWAAMTIDIATKAYASYAIKPVGHQGRVNELECLKADKQRLIQQIKWEIEQLNTQSAP